MHGPYTAHNDDAPALPASRFQASDATRDRNESRINDDAEPCFLCGRGVRGDAVVHLTTDGYLVPLTATVEERSDQGFFAVGPECAKKLPAGYAGAAPWSQS